MEKTQSIRGGDVMHPCDHLHYVVCRGKCYVPVTSGIEQSFTSIEAKFGSRRISCSDTAEVRAVNLLVLTDPSEAQLQIICRRAQDVWMKCFPNKLTRHDKLHRVDRNIPKPLSAKIDKKEK